MPLDSYPPLARPIIIEASPVVVASLVILALCAMIGVALDIGDRFTAPAPATPIGCASHPIT